MPPTQSMTWEKNLRSLTLYRAYITLHNLTKVDEFSWISALNDCVQAQKQ